MGLTLADKWKTDREELQSQQQSGPPSTVEGSGNNSRKPYASSYVWAPRTGTLDVHRLLPLSGNREWINTR